MSEMLMGSQVSGTPMETRRGSANLGNAYNSMALGDPSQIIKMLQPFQRMGAQSMTNMFGFDESDIGGVLESLLADPASQTQGLFASMQPFEAAETNRQVAGLRNVFGTMGGRFSRNVAQGEGRLRSELGNQFGRARQEALLTAQGQRGGVLANLMNYMGQRQALEQQQMFEPLRLMQQFLQPGAPVFQEGMLPGLIGLAGNAFLTKMLMRGK